MRHIEKPREQDAPQVFKVWKSRHPNAKYSNFKNARIKRILKNSLITHQKYLCCYCETRIGEETSHIEHIEPQMGGLSKHTMDYSNMAASCIRDPKHNEPDFVPKSFDELVGSTLHCGHARGTHTVVSPYDERCERLFEYSFSGRVNVSRKLTDADEIKLARESIEYLRLNVPSLVLLRKIAMTEALKMKQAGASESEILRETSGKLPPFYSAALHALVWARETTPTASFQAGSRPHIY